MTPGAVRSIHGQGGVARSSLAMPGEGDTAQEASARGCGEGRGEFMQKTDGPRVSGLPCLGLSPRLG